jgi:2-furoyl-CoA dehydrogenase FAD binding subunit
VKPGAFDYLRAESVEEAIGVLAREGEDARLLAGGQSLMAMLNMRLLEPRIIVDISSIASHGSIREDGAMLEIGAAVTQAQLGRWPQLEQKAPMLHDALRHVGHFQTRNRGTVCGSIAHADPSSELPLCLAVLGGEVVLKSLKGQRRMPASEFQLGMLSTARRPDELVTAVRFPLGKPGERFAFREMARRHGDFAIVAVAARVSNANLRLGVGGASGRPEVREWTGLNASSIDDALNAFAWELEASDDIHATARYRRELVRRMGRAVAEEAGAWAS